MNIIKAGVGVYDAVTLPLYYLMQKPWLHKQAPSLIRAQREADNVWRRVGASKKARITDGCETVPELFAKLCSVYQDRPCLGHRRLLGEEFVATGSKGAFQKKKVLTDDYKWFSYREVDRRVENLMRGLQLQGVQSGDRVAIYADTRLEWLLSAQAVLRLGAVVGTVYSTLSEDAIIYALNQLKAKHVVVADELVPRLVSHQASLPFLKKLIVLNTAPETADGHHVDRYTVIPSKFGISSFDALEAAGAECYAPPPRTKPRADDLALIMYTSGSTGTPKGVMMSHRNFVAGIHCYLPQVDQFELKGDETFCAYLPLAHILELMAENILLTAGVSIGYASANTLTNRSPLIQAGAKGDVEVNIISFCCFTPSGIS